MKGVSAIAIIIVQCIAALSAIFLGYRLRTHAEIIIRWISPIMIVAGGISMLLILVSNGFGWIDIRYLQHLRPENIQSFYVGNKMIEDSSSIERITNALHSVEPCFPNDAINPIPSLVIWQRTGYRWWRMKYWKSDSHDMIIIYFGRGRDDNSPSMVESYGCSAELAAVLKDIYISWDAAP
jgi:hypothetical protein